ncbi:DUF4367 domain-containing protein [Oceanobacillus sp. CF4.6]|uniref:DUF4367 domain-containing protein n=1 Tax=Oceanobacillus sp. CF4.6 TaxID=3373080 RepID=UPI003EE77A7C
MKKRNAIIGGILGTALVISGFLLQDESTSADSFEKVKVTENNKVKSESVEGMVQEKVPFEIRKPAVIPEGLVPVEPKTKTITQGANKLNVMQQGWVDKDADKKLKYQQKELLITQSSDDGSVKPTEILSKGEKIEVSGVDAWLISRGEHNPVQIMFWKDNQYFNVRGMNIEVDKLIEIAESL